MFRPEMGEQLDLDRVKENKTLRMHKSIQRFSHHRPSQDQPENVQSMGISNMFKNKKNTCVGKSVPLPCFTPVRPCHQKVPSIVHSKNLRQENANLYVLDEHLMTQERKRRGKEKNKKRVSTGFMPQARSFVFI